jgi:hypothetical protein
VVCFLCKSQQFVTENTLCGQQGLQRDVVYLG